MASPKARTAAPKTRTKKKVLVIDVGGTHIKMGLSGTRRRLKFESGPRFTPRQLIASVREHAAGWKYDCVSMGIPTPVVHNRPAREPQNLGGGWRNFDFEKALGKPCIMINDAAMQALGSYRGGRMLFIGVGTGLGSAMVLDDVVIPLELGELSYSPRRTYEDMLGRAGRKRLGQERWEKALHEIVARLRLAFVTDYIIIGGGNAKRIEHLPPGSRLGDNRFAFTGGMRLWGVWSGRVESKKHTLVIR
jgi:polyphosphate glucokinase